MEKKWLQVRLPKELVKAVRDAAWVSGKSVREVVEEVLVGFFKVNPVRVAEPETTKASDVKSVGGRTMGATPVTGAKVEPCLKHSWVIQPGGGYKCCKCGESPKS